MEPSRLVGQVAHIRLGAARMARNEIWDQLIVKPLFRADAVELRVELTESVERRFAHQFQDMFLGVFGGDFEPSRHMVSDHFALVSAAVLFEQIVADAAADKGFFNSFDSRNLAV